MRPSKFPETTFTAPNSPSARASVRTTPYTTAHLIAGSVMRRNVCHHVAPRLVAASSSSVPISVSTGTTSRITSGRHTNAVAMTMPGGAKTTWSPASSSVGPNQPSWPYTRTIARPTTIGETDSGRSSSALSSALPGKS